MYVKRLKGSPNRKTIARLRFFRLSWLLRHCKHIFNMPCMYSHVYIIYIHIYCICLYISVVLSAASKYKTHRPYSVASYRGLISPLHFSKQQQQQQLIQLGRGRTGSRDTLSQCVWWFAWWFINPGSPSSSFPAHAQRVAPHPRMRFKVARPSFGPYCWLPPRHTSTIYVCTCMCTHIGVVSDSDWVRPKANHLASFFSAKEELATYVPNWQATPPVQQYLPHRPAPSSTLIEHVSLSQLFSGNAGEKQLWGWLIRALILRVVFAFVRVFAA